jgi:CHASE2 domain-containing sensor protein
MTDASHIPPAQITSKKRQIGLDLLKGVLFIVLLAGIKVIVEHTPFGESIERSGYDLLQKQLSSPDSLPVVVIDFSALEPAEFNVNGQIGIATPRKTLQELITAATEAKARVIGVDIDFSPGLTGYMYPGDPQFFESCLRNKVPVVLGISRTESLTPDKWLASKDYKALAASMIVPNDTRKMPKWIRVDKDAPRGPTLGAALAERFQQGESSLAKWLHEYQLVEQVSEKELGEGVVVGEFPVDYSPLKTLIDKTFTTANPIVVKDQEHLLRDKIVLFGRGKLNNDGDRFTVEGFKQQVPGIYIHASAAYTLHNARLYELTSGTRLGIDFLLSFIVLIIVIALRYYFGLDHHLLQIVFTVLIIVLALIFGVAFVAQTRILWTDFILVLAVLILHVPVERLVLKAPGAFKNIFQGAKRRIQALHASFAQKGSNESK